MPGRLKNDIVGLVIPSSDSASSDAFIRAFGKASWKTNSYIDRIERLERQMIAMQREIDRLIVFAKKSSQAIDAFGKSLSKLEKYRG
jgi:delta 1-pyrroline-5-carboxylate dehydrogenase